MPNAYFTRNRKITHSYQQSYKHYYPAKSKKVTFAT
jgi:hypothetical protein